MSIADDYLFLVDENLTPDLAVQLRESGLRAYHVNEGRTKNRRVTDDMIRRFTLNHDAVVVTADDDFVKSYLARGVPEKVVFVFNAPTKETMLAAFREHLGTLLHLMESCDLVEISGEGARAPIQ